MSEPLVSIIIPTFNRADLILETLESIQNQTYQNWECIVVDDGSSDNTEEILGNLIEKDPRFKYFNRPDNREKGANACRNIGFEQSEGEFINWFDSDDLMLPEKLTSQIDRLQDSEHPFTVCQTNVFEGDTNNILGLRKEAIFSTDFFNDFITNKIKWLTQAPMLRRDFVVQNNLKFDETLSKAQERDFFVKVLDKVQSYDHDSRVYVLFRKHKNSISYGKVTAQKCRSTFKVNHNILVSYRQKLNSDSIIYLKQKLKSEIKKGLLLKDYSLTNEFMAQLQELKVLTPMEQLRLKLGIFTLKNFGKGETFFK